MIFFGFLRIMVLRRINSARVGQTLRVSQKPWSIALGILAMKPSSLEEIRLTRANEHNLKNLNLNIPRGKITVITGVSGSGKSSLAFDTILAESNRRFFYTLSHYTRQFLDLGSRPAVGSISGLSPAIALAQNENPTLHPGQCWIIDRYFRAFRSPICSFWGKNTVRSTNCLLMAVAWSR